MQVKKIDPEIDVQTLDDDELLMAHTALHSFYREFRVDEQVEDDRSIDGWTQEDVVEKHDQIRDEMGDRDIAHQELSDLDDIEPEQSAVSTWTSELAQSEDPEEFIQSNPPEMDWYLDAIDEVEQIDASIDLRDYVTLSATDIDELDEEEHPVQWLSSVAPEGVVGYSLNDETNAGVVLSKNGDDFEVIVDDESVYQSEKGDVAYAHYEELQNHITQGTESDEAVEDVFDTQQEEEDEWTKEDQLQGTILEGHDVPEHQWYVWDTEEAQNWVARQGFDVEESEEEGEFLTFEVAESGQFEVLENEWRGPWHPPATFVQGIDPRPVLLTIGKQEEDAIEGEIQAVKFQISEPPELPDQSIDEEVDWYWYKFSQQEAREWLKGQDIAAGEAEQNGPFLHFEVEESDRYDSLETVWEGTREPTDSLAGGEKPRRATYGVDGDERELQAVEFLVEPTVEQKALQYIEEHNIELE